MNLGTSRLRPGADSRPWTSAVFAAGDYAGAAMYGDPATWEYHAARAMLLADPAAFAALADFATPAAQLHAAAARWIHGDTARARRELAGIDLEHARNLARLLDQPRIRVLAQLPWVAGAMTDLGGGAMHDHQFELRTIGHRTGDRRQRPYADVTRCLDDGFAPDFYVAAMVEWHHLPPNLQALPCPLFGHIADHDLHIQTIRPWLDLFDELCVTDRTEWLDVQGLGRGAVSSFPKVFGLPGDLPPIPTADRPLDFFVSGTMLDPYHPDKARVLHELLGMHGIDLRVVRGFTGTMTFYALLAASKASFTFVRRPGAMPTRGLESLALGCAVALQEESVLGLWLGRAEGVVTYGGNRGDLAAAVREVLDDWRHFGPAARRGAELVRRQFALPQVASQYLRFLTFRAAAPRAARQLVDSSTWCQKRICISRTWLPDDPAVRRRTMQANFRHLGAVLARAPSATTLVDMARELLCEFVFYEQKKQCERNERSYLADAIALLEKCGRLWPDHLAARFLLVRALWHHGDAAQRMQALQLAHDAIEGDPARWRIGPRDDVMPFDFHADCFDYRHYLDLVARAEKGERVPTIDFVRPILAALAGYVARKTGKPSLHEFAVANDPSFARYRLDLAKALIARGGADGRTRARALLVELAAGSTELAPAAALLRREFGEAALQECLDADSVRAVARMEVDTIDAARSVRELFAVEQRAVKIAANAHLALPAPPRSPRVTVLVPLVGSTAECADLVAELEGQIGAETCALVVAAAPGELDSASRASMAGSLAGCRCVPVDGHAPFAARLTACVSAASTTLLTIALPGDRWRPDAISTLADELDAHPDVDLVFASEGWTDHVPAQFRPSACIGFSCPPPAAHLRMATTNGIGLHPMWRRSLHDQHGGFDARYGSAAAYEFWLRALAKRQVRQLPQLLTTSPAGAAWRVQCDPAADLGAVARARRALVPELAALPFTPQRALPAAMLATGIGDEADSHARLGILSEAERQDARGLETFLGTVLLQGDTSTAVCLLRAAIAQLPDLIAPRLALANLLDASGLPGSREVLLAARTCEPYRRVVARQLAAREVLAPDATPEAMPCPT